MTLVSSVVATTDSYTQMMWRGFADVYLLRKHTGMLGQMFTFCVFSVIAMSSYLYIVKSELPLVIQTFLKADPESQWVWSL